MAKKDKVDKIKKIIAKRAEKQDNEKIPVVSASTTVLETRIDNLNQRIDRIVFAIDNSKRVKGL